MFRVFSGIPSVYFTYSYLGPILVAMLQRYCVNFQTNTFETALNLLILLTLSSGRRTCGLMAKKLDCILEVSEFELNLPYYVHFLANTLEKVMNFLTNPG